MSKTIDWLNELGIKSLIVIPDYINIVGSTVRDEDSKEFEDIDILVKDKIISGNLIARLNQVFGEDKIHFNAEPTGPHDKHISIYDLVLVRKDVFKEISPLSYENIASDDLAPANEATSEIIEQEKAAVTPETVLEGSEELLTTPGSLQAEGATGETFQGSSEAPEESDSKNSVEETKDPNMKDEITPIEEKGAFAKMLERDGYLKYCVGSLFTKSKILDIASYNPYRLGVLQLKDDFRTLGYWYYTMGRGRKMTIQRDGVIVELTNDIVLGLMERVMESQCKRRIIVYHPTSMKDAARELFNKAKDNLISKGVFVPIRD